MKEPSTQTTDGERTLLRKYLDPRPGYWVCAVCFSTQPQPEDCHCRTVPRIELTEHGPKVISNGQ